MTIIIVPLSDYQYADNWRKEATSLWNGGAYIWMAEQIGVKQGTWVLEIGCGSGASTAAIAATGARVVSIEANADAVQIALKFLQKNNIQAESCSPAALKERLNTSSSSVFIVEADVCNSIVSDCLPNNFFSGICCWLIGAGPVTIARVLGPEYGATPTRIGAKANAGPPVLREKIHKRTYDLASEVVIKGGTIVIVDRNFSEAMNDPRMVEGSKVYHEGCANGRCGIGNFQMISRLAPPDFGTSQIGIGANKLVNQSPSLSLFLTSFFVT